MIKVMFVCLGNICRSPMADGIFQYLVQQAGLEDKIVVDSSGTSNYHVGERPHSGTRQVLIAHDIHYTHRSQQVTRHHLVEADYLVAMDSSNLNNLKLMDRAGVTDGKLSLLLEHAPQPGRRDVPDPYYEGNFEKVYQLVETGCKGLLTFIRRENNL